MAGRGPAPSANPVRRNHRNSGTTLPAEGYTGPIPEWPIPPDVQLTARLNVLRSEQQALETALDNCGDPKEANKLRYRLGKNVEAIAQIEATIAGAAEVEMQIWADLWRTPQAAAWIRMRWTREVAQYARWKAKGELGDLDSAKEARMLADRLGLTPRSLQELRWQIAVDEIADEREASWRGTSARDRMKAV